jgi:hypothetical protein
MNAMYPVYDVTAATTDRPEALGTKEKFWLLPEQGGELPFSPHLFKIGRANTGENWAEKVCYEILAHIQMPAARYNFAVYNGTPGVVSQRFMPNTGSFWPANTLLAQSVEEYDGTRRFKQRKYQLSSSIGILRAGRIGPPLSRPAIYDQVTAAEFLVGYLVFDALVGNTDRHHENWGVVVMTDEYGDTSFSLAPTFDHASSLGRNETDDARRRRLTTSDERDTVQAYAARARSAFYQSAASERTMLQKETLVELIRAYREPTRFWAKILCDVPTAVFESIFARISPQLISDEATLFALAMLSANQQMIREVAGV